jgi:hypothetical protein
LTKSGSVTGAARSWRWATEPSPGSTGKLADGGCGGQSVFPSSGSDWRYTPEKASEICGAGADSIRYLARRAAKCKTNILLGFNSAKYYHGDLMERAMILMLGLTNNWGRKGTGIRIWCVGPWDGIGLFGAKQRPGAEATIEVLETLDRMLDFQAGNARTRATAMGSVRRPAWTTRPASSGTTIAAWRTGTAANGRPSMSAVHEYCRRPAQGW